MVPRLAPRRSGPLLELAAFREVPYTLFAIGSFFCKSHPCEVSMIRFHADGDDGTSGVSILLFTSKQCPSCICENLEADEF